MKRALVFLVVLAMTQVQTVAWAEEASPADDRIHRPGADETQSQQPDQCSMVQAALKGACTPGDLPKMPDISQVGIDYSKRADDCGRLQKISRDLKSLLDLNFSKESSCYRLYREAINSGCSNVDQIYSKSEEKFQKFKDDFPSINGPIGRLQRQLGCPTDPYPGVS